MSRLLSRNNLIFTHRTKCQPSRIILNVAWVALALIASSPVVCADETPEFPPPGKLNPDQLSGIEDLNRPRRELITAALKLAQDYDLSRYIYGSADPEQGGLDCSGAIYYLLRQSGLKPARSSDGQFQWLMDQGRIVIVPEEATSFDHPVFEALQPGDLLFWSGTYEPVVKRLNKITHVQIYLGVNRRAENAS